MPLHLEYRPKDLDEVVGNDATVNMLRGLLARPKDKRPRAFLFEGPSGCGKTTLARIVASELGCGDMDFHEVDSADFRGVEFVRELRHRMLHSPMGGQVRAWLLDECHQLTKDAQAALLKSLEDTPAHVVLMLATTDPQKLLPTILNRCTRLPVQLLDESQLFRLLRRVVGGAELDVGKEAMKAIAAASKGSPRSALTILDRVVELEPEQQLAAIAQGDLEERQTIELCRALFKGAAWKTVAGILGDIKEEPESIRRAVLGYCAAVMEKGEEHPQAYVVMDAFRNHFYDNGRPGLVLACYEAAVSNR